MLKQMKQYQNPVLFMLFIATGLLGCSLQKELPPAREQTQIDKIFDNSLEKNQQIAQQATQPAAPSENVKLLDALLPPVQKLPPPQQAMRFNMAISDLPAKQFFMGLVEDTDTNIIIHPDVTGNITLNLKNVTVSDVLMIVKEVYGFNYKQKANNYFIYPNIMQTRLFHINYINLSRSGSSNIDVSSGQITKTQNDSSSASSDSESTANTKFGTQLKTEFKVDLWKELSTSLRTIIGDKDGRDIVINPQTGIILVKAMPDELSRVEEFLESTQMITGRQVLLEAKIVEVELSDGFQAGISWAALGKPGDGKNVVGGFRPVGQPDGNGLPETLNSLAGPFGGIFSLTLDLNDFTAMIDLLGTQGNVQILSSPRIATMNNQKAVIKVGTDRFFVTDLNSSNTSGNDGSASEIPDVELTPFFSGVALDVTPQIDQKGEIILHIHPSISDVTEDDRNIQFSDDLAISLPMAKSTIRESDSIIRAKNGQMVIIGGLLKQRMIMPVSPSSVISLSLAMPLNISVNYQ